jgi:ligand-binding sensor protein
MAEAKQTEKPVIGECDAGMMKISVPVFAEGEFLGAVGGCGLLPEGGEVETFLIEKTLGLSEKEIADLCEGLGTMMEEEAQDMAEFIATRIDQYVKAAV